LESAELSALLARVKTAQAVGDKVQNSSEANQILAYALSPRRLLAKMTRGSLANYLSSHHIQATNTHPEKAVCEDLILAMWTKKLANPAQATAKQWQVQSCQHNWDHWPCLWVSRATPSVKHSFNCAALACTVLGPSADVAVV